MGMKEEVFTFEYNGKKYKQEQDKAQQQMKDAGWDGCKFCEKCPQEIRDACNDWLEGEYTESGRSEFGKKYKELEQAMGNHRHCGKYGRPELIG